MHDILFHTVHALGEIRMTQPATPQNVTIALGGVQANLTCYGFHVWAEDFLAASKAYVAIARKGSLVAHFLCCQSLELGLKAYLSLKGASRRTLARKPFGHNLDRLADESNRHGLANFVQLTPADKSIIRVASAWYDTPGGKRLQYFGLLDAMTGFRGAPDYAALAKACHADAVK